MQQHSLPQKSLAGRGFGSTRNHRACFFEPSGLHSIISVPPLCRLSLRTPPSWPTATPVALLLLLMTAISGVGVGSPGESGVGGTGTVAAVTPALDEPVPVGAQFPGR